MESERKCLLGKGNHTAKVTASDSASPLNVRGALPQGQRIRLVLVVVGTGFFGFVAGMTWTTSYLIKPVQDSCSPPWSFSATVYGTSALAAGWILSGVVGFCIRETQLVLWSVVGIVVIGISNGVAGGTVLFCQQMGTYGEVIYVGTFCLFSVGINVCYMATFKLALTWLPGRAGLAGGIFPLSTGFGSLVISQIILALRSLFSDDHINQGTIFFCLGVLFIIVSSPWLPIISVPPEDTESEEKLFTRPTRGHSTWQNVWNLLMSRHTVGFSVMALCAYIPSISIMMYQEPLMKSLWNTTNPPISTLSAILMTAYLTGRALCLIISDKIGLKRIWLLCFLLQALLLLCLAVLVTVRSRHSWSRYGAFVILVAYAIVNPVFKVAAAGLCDHVYNEQQMPALGFLTMLSGIAGIAGPLIIHGMYDHFSSYKQFLYGSAGLSFIGFIALLLIKPATRTDDKLPSEVEPHSCHVAVSDKE